MFSIWNILCFKSLKSAWFEWIMTFDPCLNFIIVLCTSWKIYLDKRRNLAALAKKLSFYCVFCSSKRQIFGHPPIPPRFRAEALSRYCRLDYYGDIKTLNSLYIAFQLIEEAGRIVAGKSKCEFHFVKSCIRRLAEEVDTILYFGIAKRGLVRPKSDTLGKWF